MHAHSESTRVHVHTQVRTQVHTPAPYRGPKAARGETITRAKTCPAPQAEGISAKRGARRGAIQSAEPLGGRQPDRVQASRAHMAQTLISHRPEAADPGRGRVTHPQGPHPL